MKNNSLIERIRELPEAGSFTNSVDPRDVIAELEKEKEYLDDWITLLGAMKKPTSMQSWISSERFKEK